MQTRHTGGIATGNVVDAFGFSNSRTYVPPLRTAVLSNTHKHEELRPTPLTYEQAISGRYADHLISIDGLVLSQLRFAP